MRTPGDVHEMEDYEDRATSPDHETFASILTRHLSRRDVLRAALAAPIVLGAPGLLRPAAAGSDRPATLTFSPLAANDHDDVLVPPGYAWEIVLKWGDPVLPGAPAFAVDAQTPAAQAQQFGYNNDYVGFVPLTDERERPTGPIPRPRYGLLVVNHEYSDARLMFPGYVKGQPTADQVDIEIAAHGLTVVEIERVDGAWRPRLSHRFNRRLTGASPFVISGPAAGHDWMRTSHDPTGRHVLGTLNNCAGGKTPWGTILTCEENFNGYFGHRGALTADDPRRAAHDRYGLYEGDSGRRWEHFHDRFDVRKEPNEAFRFGWVVEIDPYDPEWTPRKRTALGRMKHEGANVTLAKDGRAVVYMGDDQAFEHVYKFVSAGRVNPDDPRANRDLLDDGTLYVAKYHDDGRGEWLPLLAGSGPLTPENGLPDQASVLINARHASDLLGATRMDRPEDIEISPVDGRVYVACTNNSARQGQDTDAANPRGPNRHGHVIEMEEDSGDAAARAFRWEVLLLCGDPDTPDSGAYFAGLDPRERPAISCPDNLGFDQSGNLWISTDGAPRKIDCNDGLYAIPVRGPDRGKLTRFATLPRGAECCGPEFTGDDLSLFLAVQHPGERGTLAEPQSAWPHDSAPPKSAVVCVYRPDGRRIGV